jgi:hypothetical protein
LCIVFLFELKIDAQLILFACRAIEEVFMLLQQEVELLLIILLQAHCFCNCLTDVWLEWLSLESHPFDPIQEL